LLLSKNNEISQEMPDFRVKLNVWSTCYVVCFRMMARHTGVSTDTDSDSTPTTYCQAVVISWAPTGVGKRGHLPPSGNVVKCFCALVVTGKRSVDELFMHYFHNPLSASGGFAPIPPPGLPPWTQLGNFRIQTPNLSTPGKNPVGAHASSRSTLST